MENNSFNNITDSAFFGKVNAVISHEIKNIMAIISETAGLMQDLTEMAKKNGRLDVDTVHNCCTDIVDEIQRGFKTVRTMNQFSHNYDEPMKDVNVWDIIQLSYGLTQFLSFSTEVTFDASSEKNATALTCPYRLQQLVYLLFESSYKSAGINGKVEVAVTQSTDGNVVIKMTPTGGEKIHVIVSDEMNTAADSIKAVVETDGDDETYIVVVPEKSI